MSKQVPITPIYGRGDLVEMLDAEYGMVVANIEDLTEDQFKARVNPSTHSILEVIWHLYFPEGNPPRPANKAEALKGLQSWYELHRAKAGDPEALNESETWWTGEQMTYRAYLTGFVIRHLAYHLGEIVMLRQALGIDKGQFYHEE